MVVPRYRGRCIGSHMADSIERIREMYAVLPRGPWGIIAQEAIGTLLTEIERLKNEVAIAEARKDRWRKKANHFGRMYALSQKAEPDD